MMGAFLDKPRMHGMILYMNKTKLLLSVLAMAFGAFMVVYGGYDDSPGAQLLGLVAVILGIVGVVKSKKKAPTQT
jgi:hypothetical protein